jgi:gliding motility-associated-like protein
MVYRPISTNGVQGSVDSSVTKLKTGQYFVTVTDAAQQTLIDTINIKDYPVYITCHATSKCSETELWNWEVDDIFVYQSTAVQIKTSVDKKLSPPFTYLFDIGNALPFSFAIYGIPDTSRLVVFDSYSGCTLDTTLVFNGNPNDYPTTLAPPLDTLVNFGDTLVLDPKINIPLSIIESVQWSSNPSVLLCDGCFTLNHIVKDLSKIDFQVKVKTIYGCEYYTTMSIRVNPPPVVLLPKTCFIPNAFSPNEDNINDFFAPYPGIDVAKIIDFQVFTYDGFSIFQLQNIDASFNQVIPGWDGTFRNKPLPTGNYIYKILLKYTDGTEEEKSGLLLLWRK